MAEVHCGGILRGLICILLVVLCFCLGPVASASPPALTVNEFVRELLDRNPELKSLQHKIESSKSKITSSKGLMDPMLMVDAMNLPVDSFALNESEMSGINLGIKQNLPFPTKLSTRGAIARTRYRQNEYEYQEMLYQLVFKFKAALYELLYTEDALAIHRRNRQRLESLIRVLEAKYTNEGTTQQSLLQTRIEIEKINANLQMLSSKRQMIQARINTLLVRPVGTPVRVAGHSVRIESLGYSLNQLTELALAGRPWVNKSRFSIQEKQKTTSLARQSLLPDFDFAATYTIRQPDSMMGTDGTDFASLGVAVSVPIVNFNRHNHEIKAAQQNEMAEKQKHGMIEEEVKNEIAEIYYELENIRSQIHLYSSRIIPQLHSMVSTSQKTFETGATEYINLISAQRMLFDNQLKQTRLRYDCMKKQAELEMAVGQPIFTKGHES